MADHKPTIAEAAAKARARRKGKEKSGKSAAKVPAAESGLIASIRKALSSESNVNRIDSAVDAVTKGIEDDG